MRSRTILIIIAAVAVFWSAAHPIGLFVTDVGNLITSFGHGITQLSNTMKTPG